MEPVLFGINILYIYFVYSLNEVKNLLFRFMVDSFEIIAYMIAYCRLCLIYQSEI